MALPSTMHLGSFAGDDQSLNRVWQHCGSVSPDSSLKPFTGANLPLNSFTTRASTSSEHQRRLMRVRKLSCCRSECHAPSHLIDLAQTTSTNRAIQPILQAHPRHHESRACKQRPMGDSINESTGITTLLRANQFHMPTSLSVGENIVSHCFGHLVTELGMHSFS